MQSYRKRLKLNFSDYTSPAPFVFSVITIASVMLLLARIGINTRNIFNGGEVKSGPFFGPNLLLYGGFAVAAGISSFAYGMKFLRQRKLMQDIPTSKVRSMALGLVELNGKVEKLYDFVTPMSKTPCAYFLHVIEVQVKDKNGSHWQEISRFCSTMPFYLEDDTGRVLVNPEGIDLRYDPRFENIDASGRRNREWFILDGEPAYLIGRAQKSRDFLQEASEKLTLEIRKIKNDPERMKQFDANRDGAIDAEEWDAAVRQIQAELERQEACQAPKDGLADISVGKGTEEDDIFIISERSEKTLQKQLLWQGGALVSAGIAVLAGIVYFIALN
jgi:hypothetical protein